MFKNVTDERGNRGALGNMMESSDGVHGETREGARVDMHVRCDKESPMRRPGKT